MILDLINPKTGIRKTIPEDWISVFEDSMHSRGYIGVLKYRVNPGKKGFLLVRHTGGLGDIITLIPTVNYILKFITTDLTVCLQKEFYWLFSSLPVKFIPYPEFKISMASNYLFFTDMYCPAGDHEDSCNYNPSKGRIENFLNVVTDSTDYIDFNINKKVVAIHHSSSRKRVGIQLRSANISKDISFDVLNYIYRALDEIVDVYFIDKKEVKGKRSYFGVGLDELSKIIKSMDLIIAADSGLFHLAGLLHVKTIGVFGPTNGELTAKYYKSADVIQLNNYAECAIPCYYSCHNNYRCAGKIGECMSSLNVKFLLEKCYKLLL